MYADSNNANFKTLKSVTVYYMHVEYIHIFHNTFNLVLSLRTIKLVEELGRYMNL